MREGRRDASTEPDTPLRSRRVGTVKIRADRLNRPSSAHPGRLVRVRECLQNMVQFTWREDGKELYKQTFSGDVRRHLSLPARSAHGRSRARLVQANGIIQHFGNSVRWYDSQRKESRASAMVVKIES
jgi:hypothetical protein